MIQNHDLQCLNKGVEMVIKNNKIIFLTIWLLFIFIFASACSRSEPIVNEPIQNQNNTEPINSDKLQEEEINNEYLIFEISSNNIENTPSKTWKPLWQYTAQNKGSIVVKNILLNSQQCLLINNPLVDYDDYQTIIPPDTFYDDIFALKPETKQKLWQYRINSICSLRFSCLLFGSRYSSLASFPLTEISKKCNFTC